jgi:hypothetical protein
MQSPKALASLAANIDGMALGDGDLTDYACG